VTISKRLILPGALALALVGCGAWPAAAPSAAADAWVGTWGTAPQLTEPGNMPPAPGLAGNTLRQVVRVSIGGERLRLRLSNEYGDGPLTVRSARVGSSVGDGAVEPASERVLTFGGADSVTIPVGAVVHSDPFAFQLAPRQDVAITLHFGAVPDALTGHPGSRTTSYILPGDATPAERMDAAVRADRWFVIRGIDVVAPDAPGAVIAIGNSITDGRGSGTNRQNRWPDELARRLHADPRTARVAVLNMGIGGNCVLRACLGPAALARFGSDVLEQAGARWLVILHGVNDLGQAAGAEAADAVADDLTDAYRRMTAQARSRGIRVYGATILPFGGSAYDSPEREAARQTLNAWIRTSGSFDGVIDLDAALRDPARPARLRPEADTGDHLHPNEAGHRMIADAIDLSLFVPER
jgi:lysophospholipase L1-like esterase